MTRKLALLALAGITVLPGIALAEDGVTTGQFVANNVWMMIAAALVFIMHLGFSMVETGLTRAKNTVNILFKNVFIICAGILTYAICGFNLMYPGEFGMIDGVLGFAGFGVAADEAARLTRHQVPDWKQLARQIARAEPSSVRQMRGLGPTHSATGARRTPARTDHSPPTLETKQK